MFLITAGAASVGLIAEWATIDFSRESSNFHLRRTGLSFITVLCTFCVQVTYYIQLLNIELYTTLSSKQPFYL